MPGHRSRRDRHVDEPGPLVEEDVELTDLEERVEEEPEEAVNATDPARHDDEDR